MNAEAVGFAVFTGLVLALVGAGLLTRIWRPRSEMTPEQIEEEEDEHQVW